MSEWLRCLFFGLSGVLIMSGLTYRVKATLGRALGTTSLSGFFALILELSGFSLLGYLIYTYKMDGLWLGLLVFFLSSIGTILFYLLARDSPIR